MPTYSVRDKDTDEMEEMFCSWSSLQEYLKENPSKESVITSAPMIVSGTGMSGNIKVDGGFNEVLQRVKPILTVLLQVDTPRSLSRI